MNEPKSLLEKTTPGPWHSHMLGGGKGGPNSYSITTNKEWGGDEGVTHITIARVHGRPNGVAGWDAKLIAQAPEVCAAVRRSRDALVTAKGALRIWHGEVGWDEYQHSPEMRTLNATIDELNRLL